MWSADRIKYYKHIHYARGHVNYPDWRGSKVIKYPSDLILYSEAIFANKPDWIVETGTAYGGSAMFFGDMLSLINAPGKVITVDTEPRRTVDHPMVEQIVGSSTDSAIVNRIKGQVSGKVMVVLDSDHSRKHVKWELFHYSKVVTPGQFMVVEDCYSKSQEMHTPGEAVEWFLKRNSKFKMEILEDRFIFAVTRGGWLRRIN